MPLREWKNKSSKTLYKNPWWEYRLDKCFIPNGNEYIYHYVHTGGSAMIIPVTDSGKILLVNQYRYLNRMFSIEFPAGGIKDGENPDCIAQKELIEETGYEGKLIKAGFFNPFNGVTDEFCHVYIATDLSPSDKHSKDISEEFEILERKPEEIEKLIQNNIIHDGMTMAAWMLGKDKI